MVLLTVGILLGVLGFLAVFWKLSTDMLKESRRLRRWAEVERLLHREHINTLVVKAAEEDDPLIQAELSFALTSYRELD